LELSGLKGEPKSLERERFVNLWSATVYLRMYVWLI